jgi:hypothetical protein
MEAREKTVTVNCRKCKRKLRKPKSVEEGIGPVCAKREKIEELKRISLATMTPEEKKELDELSCPTEAPFITTLDEFLNLSKTITL